MPLTSIKIKAFRNIFSANIENLAPFNLIYGKNGSGKTSLLEAIYMLSTAKSFRTSQVNNTIKDGETTCIIVANLTDNDAQPHLIGLERSSDGKKTCKLDGEYCNRISTITSMLPIKLIPANSHEIYTEGPNDRRQLLDWGLFHVKHHYHHQWSDYQRVLKQRNAALKQNTTQSALLPWDEQLSQLAEQLDQARREYLNEITPFFTDLLLQLLPDFNCELRYQRGWSENTPLLQQLLAQYYRDQAAGFTTQGPHRADIQLYVGNKPVDELLSQGQLKQAAYALHLAQGKLMLSKEQTAPLFLIDDLPSELDQDNQRRVGKALTELKTQTFLTGIEAKPLVDSIGSHPHQLFHVKHGVVELAESDPT